MPEARKAGEDQAVAAIRKDAAGRLTDSIAPRGKAFAHRWTVYSGGAWP